MAMKRLFHDTDNGKVYLQLDGQLRHVANPDVHKNILRPGLPMENFNSTLIKPLPPYGPSLDCGLMRDSSNGKVYLIDSANGTLGKRHITNPAVSDYYGFNTSAINVPHYIAEAVPNHIRGDIRI